MDDAKIFRVAIGMLRERGDNLRKLASCERDTPDECGICRLAKAAKRQCQELDRTANWLAHKLEGNSVMDNCQHCNGEGWVQDPYTASATNEPVLIPCAACGGSGEAKVVPHPVFQDLLRNWRGVF